MMGIFVIALLFFIFLSVFYLLVSYVAERIYLMGVLKQFGVKYKILAWLPMYGQYVYGKAAGMHRMGIVLALQHTAVAICFIFLSVLDADFLIFEIIMILSGVGLLLKWIVDHKMYHRINPEKRWLFTILSVLSLGWFRPVVLLLYRKKLTEAGVINLHKTDENNL